MNKEMEGVKEWAGRGRVRNKIKTNKMIIKCCRAARELTQIEREREAKIYILSTEQI